MYRRFRGFLGMRVHKDLLENDSRKLHSEIMHKGKCVPLCNMQKLSTCKIKLQNAIDKCGDLCYNLYAEMLAVYIYRMLARCSKCLYFGGYGCFRRMKFYGGTEQNENVLAERCDRYG